jgi:hypothetical protein
MGRFDRAIATATRAIERNGRPCLWAKPAALGPGSTPARPVPGVAPDPVPVTILFLPGKSNGLAALLSMFAGTDVPQSGMAGLMAAVPFTPALGDTVIAQTVDDGLPETRWAIADNNGIELLAPNGQPILYFLRFAR